GMAVAGGLGHHRDRRWDRDQHLRAPYGAHRPADVSRVPGSRRCGSNRTRIGPGAALAPFAMDRDAGSMAEHARALLSDHFGRIADLVEDLTDGLSEETATWRPEPEANTIAWLVWHLARVQDDHIADAAGIEQIWPRWHQH